MVGLAVTCVAGNLHAENRVTNQVGEYSFSMPEGYGMPQEAAGTSVTIKKDNVLSTMVPTVTMSIVPLDSALDQYDQLINTLKRARYNRKASMRLLRKTSLKTSRGIPGWELSYTQPEKSGKEAVVMHILLDRDTEHMLLIEGTALQDSRTDFAITCDQLINSIEYGQ